MRGLAALRSALWIASSRLNNGRVQLELSAREGAFLLEVCRTVMSFKYIDNIATADCAVEIESHTLPQLFEDAAMSLVSRMADISTVRKTHSWNLELRESSIEMLFYEWLSELIFLKDAEAVLFSEFRINEISDGPVFKLSATVRGEPIDHERHDIAVDIKAVTLHMFNVEQAGNIWKAFVIFDL